MALYVQTQYQVKKDVKNTLALLVLWACFNCGNSDVATLGPSSPKTQPTVYDALTKNNNVKIIIRTNIDFKFYGNGNQTENERNARKEEFQKIRNKIVSVLGEHKIIQRDLKLINGFAATVDQKTLSILESMPEILEINLDGVVHPTLDESAQNVHAPDAWSMTNPSHQSLDGTGVRIAIIDSGVEYTHPDLGGCLGPNCKVIGGYDFIHNDNDPNDELGHGTHVAGIAAGNGTYPGVAPGAKILSYKIYDYEANGTYSSVIAAIEAAMDPNSDGDTSDHADVINMSLGGPGNPDDDLSEAVDNASAVGVISAISAGNDGSALATILSPGTAATAITVAASLKSSQIGTVNQDPIASFSSRGPVIWNNIDYQKPDISAPGVDICSARFAFTHAYYTSCLDQQHVRLSGTSMSAPHVAGALAILKQANPNLTPSEAKQILKSTATDLGVSYNDQGAGLLNIQNALASMDEFHPRVSISPNYWSVKSSKWLKTVNGIATEKSSNNREGLSQKKVQTKSTDIGTIQELDLSGSILAIPFSYSQEFQVTGLNLAKSSSLLSISLNQPVTGVTFSSDEEISVSNNSTASFFASVIVNHSIAVPGVYARKIEIRNAANQLVGSIHVNLSLSATYPGDTAPPPQLPPVDNFDAYLKTTVIDMYPDPKDEYIHDHKLSWDYVPLPDTNYYFVIRYDVYKSNYDEIFSNELITWDKNYTFKGVNQGGVCDYPGATYVYYTVSAFSLDYGYYGNSEWPQSIPVDCP